LSSEKIAPFSRGPRWAPILAPFSAAVVFDHLQIVRRLEPQVTPSEPPGRDSFLRKVSCSSGSLQLKGLHLLHGAGAFQLARRRACSFSLAAQLFSRNSAALFIDYLQREPSAAQLYSISHSGVLALTGQLTFISTGPPPPNLRFAESRNERPQSAWMNKSSSSRIPVRRTLFDQACPSTSCSPRKDAPTIGLRGCSTR